MNSLSLCVNLTTLVSIDHAADSRTDVGGRGGGSGDRHGVLRTWTDVHNIGL